MEFRVSIVEQSWLDGSSPEEDLCSHGKIKLVIGGVSITSGNEDYGVSESALSLLRTLDIDHSAEQPVAERLIFHGCGTMLMMGCPIGVDWEVNRSGNSVRLSNAVRYDGTGESSAVRFPNVIVEMPEEEYRREVVAFAKEAGSLFEGVEKRFTDEFDRQQYQEFWAEYRLLLRRYGNAI